MLRIPSQYHTTYRAKHVIAPSVGATMASCDTRAASIRPRDGAMMLDAGKRMGSAAIIVGADAPPHFVTRSCDQRGGDADHWFTIRTKVERMPRID